ncbi:gluconokinase [Pseudorhodobacter aquimaris]|uniref:gluconokinase n=1 Tax=Pseudorhodobacter aquimaris TaxID=687412 RepID=UPI000A820645|nr:gluconokinase [Pseudorhodobacter aquimaris]
MRLASGRYVLMGVAGCGKSSVGVALARAIGTRYLDGDDLHPAANIAKMARGEALTDADRWPWLAKVGAALADPGILGCSALRKSYRNRIAEHAGGPVCFIYLKGSRDLIAARMAARSGHFMPATLLQSQFATLEPPTAEEPAITVDIDQPVPRIVAEITQKLHG